LALLESLSGLLLFCLHSFVKQSLLCLCYCFLFHLTKTAFWLISCFLSTVIDNELRGWILLCFYSLLRKFQVCTPVHLVWGMRTMKLCGHRRVILWWTDVCPQTYAPDICLPRQLPPSTNAPGTYAARTNAH